MRTFGDLASGQKCGSRGAGVAAIGPRESSGLELLVAGIDLQAFHAARHVFESRMFDVNSWQHRAPDFVVLGQAFQSGGAAVGGLASVEAAGFWDHNWDFNADFAFCKGDNVAASVGKKEVERPRHK